MGDAISLPTDKVLARRDGGVGWLTINQPERRNAISLAMWDAMMVALDRFAADPDVRAVILHGAGDRAFSAGVDVSEFEKLRANAEAAAEYRKRTSAAERAIVSFAKPVIAMIRGHCVGGGLSLALLADLRIASSDSRFGIAAAKIGLSYPYDQVRRLVQLTGPAVAKELLFTGREFTAQEALKLGLLNQIEDASALEGAVRAAAAQIAENAPLSIAAAKRSVDHAAGGAAEPDETITAMLRACNDSEDYREGRRAFMEKRKPEFKGR